MNDLLIDAHDDAFSSSSSAVGSQPFAARMFDLSIFARNGFLDEESNAKLIMSSGTKGGAFQSQVPEEPYGKNSLKRCRLMFFFRCLDTFS